MTHICNSQKADIGLCNLQCTVILATRPLNDRDSLIEQEVDQHEEDDPGATKLDKAATPHPPTRVLDLKVPVPTRWSRVSYMIYKCAIVMVVWDPFNMGYT